MNKKVLITTIAVVGLIATTGIIFVTRQNDDTTNASTASSGQVAQSEVSTPTTSDQPSAASVSPATAPSASSTAASASSTAPSTVPGTYVNLATYNANAQQYTSQKKIYFFHAPWCPICQGIDKEVSASSAKLPANSVLIKTDFDSATELRKKYGVTQQYSFVQVDDSGALLKKWSATSLDKVVSQIQ